MPCTIFLGKVSLYSDGGMLPESAGLSVIGTVILVALEGAVADGVKDDGCA